MVNLFQSLIERHEEDIEDWYFNLQDKFTFQDYVCRKKALRKGEDSCLADNVQKKKKKSKTKAKGETGRKEEL